MIIVEPRNQQRRLAMNDKVINVMAVLTVIRNEFEKTPNCRYSTELRKEAVNDVAETELIAKRYKNQDSALKTIHDACARRLKPDIGNIRDFDGLTEQWLRQNSMQLKDILLKHSKSHSQSVEVTKFFEDKS
jgi:hypothetical protein